MTRPRVVFINAVSAVLGGGITVARGLARALAKQRPGDRFVLFYSHRQVADGGVPSNVELVHLPSLASRPRRWIWEQLVFPIAVWRRGADVVLNLGGYASFPCTAPQVSVWQNPNVYAPPNRELPGFLRRYIVLQRWFQRLSMARVASNVFLTGNSLEMAGRFWNMDRIPHAVIHSGIDAERLRVWPPPDLSARERRALSIGDVYAHKNYEAMIDAIAEYRDRFGEPVRLEIVGGAAYDQRYFASLERRIRERGLVDLVSMSGRATAEQVRGKLAAARVYVVTSRLESFGLTMFEAMGAGIPVVASNATCHPEVCGDAAVYCDPDDPRDIAAALHRVLHDDALQSDLQRRGYEQIEHFPWDQSAARYLEVLDGVIGGG